MKLLSCLQWLVWKLSPLIRPRPVGAANIPGSENILVADADSAKLEIKGVDGRVRHTESVVAPEVRVVQVPQTVLCTPSGLTFYGEFVINESNFRPGNAADAAAIDKVSPWPVSRFRHRRKEIFDLLQDGTPKFFFRLRFDNYYHFLLESLPAFIIAQRAVPNLHLVLPSAPPSIFNLDLALLYGGNPSVLKPGNWQIRNQVFVPIRAGLGAHTEALQAVRSIAIGAVPADRVSIYVSRRHSSRSLAFEELLEAYLQDLGFKIVLPDDLRDVTANAKLFQSAQTVIGPHGAGLANLVFCEPGTYVLELAAMHFHNNLFGEISSRLGLSHHLAYLHSTGLTDFGSGEEAIGLVERFLTEVRGAGNLS